MKATLDCYMGCLLPEVCSYMITHVCSLLYHVLFFTLPLVGPLSIVKKHLPDSVAATMPSHPESRSEIASPGTTEVVRKKRKVSFAPSPMSSEDSFSQSSSPSKDNSPNRRSARLSRLRDSCEELLLSKSQLTMPKTVGDKSFSSSETARKLREILDTRVTRSKVAAASVSQEVATDEESVSSTVSSLASYSSISLVTSEVKRKPGRPPGAKGKKKKELESVSAKQLAQPPIKGEEEALGDKIKDYLSLYPIERKRRRKKSVQIKESKAQGE